MGRRLYFLIIMQFHNRYSRYVAGCFSGLLLMLTLLISSCGVDGSHFEIEGHLLNINQSDFYVYAENGSVDGLDTIHVEGGRFAYEVPCKHPTILYLVFPNYSVVPIFAQPGKSVSIKGDASHLKEIEVKGTDDNELYTKFREQVSKASPPEAKRAAEVFIGDHPKSVVGLWLIKKYFISDAQPDYQAALRLTQKMQSKQTDQADLSCMIRQLSSMSHVGVGSVLPTFSTYDTKGRLVSSSDLSSGLAVICTWASWSYDSMDMLRTLKQLQRQSGGRLKVVSLSVDASRSDCDGALRVDSILWPNVCDGKMFDSQPLQQLGMMGVPDNIIVKNNRIVARNLMGTQLHDKIMELLK